VRVRTDFKVFGDAASAWSAFADDKVGVAIAWVIWLDSNGIRASHANATDYKGWCVLMHANKIQLRCALIHERNGK
jgi:hypothetical protein